MKILLINQSFFPDESATARYLSDLATEMANRGHEVEVLCSQRNYFDHRQKHPLSEVIDGVRVRRLRTYLLPRTNRLFRYLNAAAMNLTFALQLLLMERRDVTIVLTTPPLIDWICVLCRRWRDARIIHWAMDINPDQAIEIGWIPRQSLLAKFLLSLQRRALRAFDAIVVLDRQARDLLREKGLDRNRIHIISLWGQLLEGANVLEAAEGFRMFHGIDDKFLVMYAGNHSICHPLDTVLFAAKELADDPRFVFFFIGGGARFAGVKKFAAENSLENIITHPYLERRELQGGLEAADLHIVSQGDEYIGIVHPSKIYNILMAGKPVLVLGREESPVAEIVKAAECGMRVSHGNTAGFVEILRSLQSESPRNRHLMGERARQAASRYRRSDLTQQWLELIEN